jgi:hypothetical protein
VVAHPGPPRIRACPIQAPGSSSHDFATRPEAHAPGALSVVVALRWGQGSVSLASLPSAVSWPGAAFPPRGPSGRFPRFHGTTRRSDSPSPVPPRFVAFARPVSRSHPRFAPMAAGCAGYGPGVGDPVPPAGSHREGVGASQVPGGPRGGRAPLSDPGGIAGARPLRRRDAAVRPGHDVGSRECVDFGVQWRGPSTGRLRFAGRVAPTPRQTRFRPLARLCRAGVDAPQGPDERFPRFASSFPKLSWRTSGSTMVHRLRFPRRAGSAAARVRPVRRRVTLD